MIKLRTKYKELNLLVKKKTEDKAIKLWQYKNIFNSKKIYKNGEKDTYKYNALHTLFYL